MKDIINKLKIKAALEYKVVLLLVLLFASILFFILYLPRLNSHRGYLEGYLHAKNTCLSPLYLGKVRKIHVKEGDRVKVGSLLLEQYGDEEQHKIKEINADLLMEQENYKQINSDFHLFEKEWKRNKALYEKGVVPLNKYESIETDYIKSKESLSKSTAKIQSINAQKDLLEFHLQQRQLKSSYDGTINEVITSEGEIADPQRPAICLIPDSFYEVVFYVPLELKAKLHNGQTLRLSYEGCEAGRSSVIYFVATQSEFKPPNLLLDTEKENISFKIKAKLEPSNCPNTIGLPARVYLDDIK